MDHLEYAIRDFGLHQYGITPTLIVILSASTIITSIALILIFRKLSKLSNSISNHHHSHTKIASSNHNETPPPIKKELTFPQQQDELHSSSFQIQIRKDSELPSEQECIKLLIEKEKFSMGEISNGGVETSQESVSSSVRAFWSLGAHSTRISIHSLSAAKNETSPPVRNVKESVKHMKQVTVVGEKKFNTSAVLTPREGTLNNKGNNRRFSTNKRSSLGGALNKTNSTSNSPVVVAYGNECVDHRAEFILHYPLKKYLDQYVNVNHLEYPFHPKHGTPYSHADSLLPYCTELLEEKIVRKSVLATLDSECQKTLFCALPFYLYCDIPFKGRLLASAFDDWNYDRVYMCLEHVLPIFSVGKCSGLSVDCGELFSVSVPVYEGIAVRQALEAMPIAGYTIDEIFQKMLERNLCTNDTTLKFTSSTEKEILKDIKEKMCCVKTSATSCRVSSSDLTYELPDKSVIRIPEQAANILSDCTEYLFNARVDADFYGPWSQNNSIQECVVKSLEKLSRVDMEAKNAMTKNIVLSGGTCLLDGFVNRFASELENAMNQNETLRKTFIKKGESEHNVNIMTRTRDDSVTLGADIFMSLNTFNDLCVVESNMTKMENIF
ncbi:hypothetical protein C9374_007655 [Naegleria lovaniensis]|uniref:Actin n=1 Tax=Naegleria lovaniensis TaxID=51637 RepID=A0AA88KG96_NAELO|nr:uncharacterized protein C9374_007655 [Naegleria lovaniensis]KAG2379017.1 hypothetical protein C9374_007655 [Naegleria lovaniensis]